MSSRIKAHTWTIFGFVTSAISLSYQYAWTQKKKKYTRTTLHQKLIKTSKRYENNIAHKIGRILIIFYMEQGVWNRCCAGTYVHGFWVWKEEQNNGTALIYCSIYFRFVHPCKILVLRWFKMDILLQVCVAVSNNAMAREANQHITQRCDISPSYRYIAFLVCVCVFAHLRWIWFLRRNGI